MPNFTMCSNPHCPIKAECRRSEASGTRPSERQSWAYFAYGDADKNGRCYEFRPKKESHDRS